MANLQLIKTIAERQGIAITELAARVGISEQQIHLMVRTNSTKINTLEKIAAELGVPVSVFFEKEPTNMKVDYHGDNGVIAQKIDSLNQRTMPPTSSSCETEHLKKTVAALEQSNADLRSQLRDKERIIQLYEKR